MRQIKVCKGIIARRRDKQDKAIIGYQTLLRKES